MGVEQRLEAGHEFGMILEHVYDRCGVDQKQRVFRESFEI